MKRSRFATTAAAATLTTLLFAQPAEAGFKSWLKRVFGKKEKVEQVVVPETRVLPVPQAEPPQPLEVGPYVPPVAEPIEVPETEKPIEVRRVIPGRTVIDDCVNCEQSDYRIKVPNQQIGRAVISRNLSDIGDSEVHVHGYDRQAFENHKSVVDPFCGDNDYVEIQLPKLSDKQRKAGYSLEFWTPSKDNSSLEQSIMAVEKDGVIRITRDELASLPEDANGYHILKTKNFLVLKDEDGKICASYALQYNAVFNTNCEPVPGTGPEHPVGHRPDVRRPNLTPRPTPNKPSASRATPHRPAVGSSAVGHRPAVGEPQEEEEIGYKEAEISVGVVSHTFDSLSSVGEEVSADADGLQLKARLEKFSNKYKIRGTLVLSKLEGELNIERPSTTDENGNYHPGESVAVPITETATDVGAKGDIKVVGNRVAIVAGGAVEWKSIDISEDVESSGYPFQEEPPSFVDQQNLYLNARGCLGFFGKEGFASSFGLFCAGATGQKINESYFVGNAEFHPSSSFEYNPEFSIDFRLTNSKGNFWFEGEGRAGKGVKTAYTSLFNGLELVGEGESNYHNFRVGIGGNLGKSGNVQWNAGVGYAHNENTFKLDPDDVQELQQEFPSFSIPTELPDTADGLSVKAGLVFRF